MQEQCAGPVTGRFHSSEGKVTVNCWEFKKCGRQAGGEKAAEMGVCAAYPEYGRDCARVAGTLCGGKVQGTFAMKLVSCMQCEYYLSPHYDRFHGRSAAR